MEIGKVLAEYDAMFGTVGLDKIEEFLVMKLKEAEEEQDFASMFTLLNESIGFYRDTTQKEKSLHDCEVLINLLEQMKLEGRVEYATSLLNIANAYRAFGLHEESLNLHEEVEKTYKKYLDSKDFSYASLYNNWSLLYQEMGDFKSAKEKLKKALSIVDLYPEAMIPQATTRTNLAVTLLQLGTKEDYRDAISYLEEAVEVFEKEGGKDFHYGAALVAMGDAKAYIQSFKEAAQYYKRGMEELEKHVGRTQNYDRVREKYENVITKENQWSDRERNLERCRKFYETYGAPMIHEKFPEYEERIAVGLVGEGSDCFGFDDEISNDHDYGLGFCMWLSEEDNEKIGKALQQEYEELIRCYETKSGLDLFFSQRRGVFTISEFYNGLLGTDYDYEKSWELDYKDISEERLATAVNGTVFRDNLGIFLGVRNQLLKYYPDDIWRLKLAQSIHEFSQYAQSNYPRMMARKDDITANLCVAKAMERVMDIVFLLNRTYAPYYKWKRKAMGQLKKLQGVEKLLEKAAMLKNQKVVWNGYSYSSDTINREDEYVDCFEEMAEMILSELREQGLVTGEDTFLERYCGEIMQGTKNPTKTRREKVAAEHDKVEVKKELEQNKEEKMEIEKNKEEEKMEIEKNKEEEKMEIEKNKEEVKMEIEKSKEEVKRAVIKSIVELEWKQFDKVKNEGGRADCQNDWNTFSIMRKSQYMAWTEELLRSYYEDLQAAERKGWNLITEKYARMMKTTAPEKYTKLEKELPALSEERLAIQEEIIKIQVGWMEVFAEKYPKMAGNARVIHTYEDTAFQTSYETYLRGELGTYSEITFLLYGRFITDLLREEKNLAYEIMNHTAKLYGYLSVEDAEGQL